MAIVRPEEMDFSGKKFSMITSGPPGVGKTTLALSAPNPVLIDFDKGVSRVKAVHRKTTIVCNTYEEVQESAGPRAAYEEAMERGRALVAGTMDGASATPALAAIRELAHSLTSERELRSLFSARVEERKCYEAA